MRIRRTTCPRHIPIQHFVVEEAKQSKLKMVNQFLLVSKLGAGSSSKVYLARDEISGKYYAAKAVRVHEQRNSAPRAASLEREIRILRIVRHPSIIRLHDVLYASNMDKAFLIMDWAECGSLQQSIKDGIAFDETVLANMFAQIAQGVKYLHTQGIVHRDVKPSNILLFLNGVVKLSDFGIGHTFESAETVIGSPAYQAPELLEDEEEDPASPEPDIDPTKGDVWSLGVSLYEAAYGVIPYNGQNLYEIVNKINNTELVIPQNRRYSKTFVDLIKKMLRKNPEERISLDEVIQHPFFNNAATVVSYKLRAQPTNHYDPEQILKIPAVVCPENFSFGTGLRSISCPLCTDNYDDGQQKPSFEKTKSVGC